MGVYFSELAPTPSLTPNPVNDLGLLRGGGELDIKRNVFYFFLILVTQKFIDFFPIRRIKSLKKKL